MLQAYSTYRPTGFDSAGAFLPEQSDWLVVPAGQNRDSGELDQSNFAAALALLGGESDTVQVYRFGHWACGWFEIIIVAPNSPAVAIAEDIAARLEDYPVLDESDFSDREWTSYAESWDSWAARDFRRDLVKAFELPNGAESALDNADNAKLREYFEACIPSGEYYISESSGVCVMVDIAIRGATRDNLAEFLRTIRA